jgi:hypothetical protein
MKRLFIALAGGLLVLLLVFFFVVVYLYESLTPTSTSIVRRAESAVPSAVLPPKPNGTTMPVTEKKEVCFDVPGVSNFQVTMRRACTTIFEKTTQKFVEPSSDQMRAWNTAVNERVAARTLAVQHEAQRIAESERERMRKEIEFWSAVLAGPAPFLVALSGFIVTLMLEGRSKKRRTSRRSSAR